MNASADMRWRHLYWHLVKSKGFVTDPANAPLVQALSRIGWTSRFTGEAGAGLDFLHMHREMIAHVDMMLASMGDPNWPRVTGWAAIPPGSSDPDWPEPAIPNLNDLSAWPPNKRRAISAIAEARSPAIRRENLAIAQALRDPAVLGQDGFTLDQLGYRIEVTVHNWMHNRFAAAPPDDGQDLSPANDWLGDPFSSHVNDYFWKLHGWIDDCIGLWELAQGEISADFSGAWVPPNEAPPLDVLLGATGSSADQRKLRARFSFPRFFETTETELRDVIREIGI